MQIIPFLRQKAWHILIPAFILVVVFISFYPCLQAGFLNWDDNVHLTENLNIRMIAWEGITWANARDIFTQKVNRTYQPLTIFSYALEFYFFKDNPFVYHFNNVILHMLVSLLVFGFMRRLKLSLWAAGLATLLFAIHPMKVESVAWVTERKDVLYALFYMLALHSYWSYLKHKRFFFFAMTFFFGLFSLLSKAMALSLPLILLLCDWFYGRKMTSFKVWLEKIPIFVLTIFIAGITYLGFARMPIQNIGDAVLLWTWTFTFYFEKFFFPYLLLPIYSYPTPVSFLNPEYFFSLLFPFVIVAGLYCARKNKHILFSFGFYFLSIFFLMRFDFRDAHIVGDRFMYLPSLGFCYFFGYAGQLLWNRIKGKKKFYQYSIFVVIAVVFALLGAKTFFQSKIWKSNITLWEYQLLYSRQNPIPFNNLAISYNGYEYKERYKKDFDEFRKKAQQDPSYLTQERNFSNPVQIGNLAERRFFMLKEALKIKRDYSDVWYNLGMMYTDLGLIDEAIKMYEEAIRSDPHMSKPYFELANLLVDKGEDRKAIMLYLSVLSLPEASEDPDTYMSLVLKYNKIIREKPSDANGDLYRQARQKTMDVYRAWVGQKGARKKDYFDLAWMYEDMGGYFSSILLYKELLKERPKDLQTMETLGSLYYESGEFDEALDIYQKIATVTPDDEKIYLNLGAIYNKKGDFKKAITQYQKVLDLNPYNRKSYFNLGYVYENMNRNKEAVSFYQAVVKIYPNYAEAYYNMANIYAKVKKLPEAIDSYKKALGIKPDHLNALINLSIVSFFAKDFDGAQQALERAKALGYEPHPQFIKALQWAKEGEGKMPGSSLKDFVDELFDVNNKEDSEQAR